MVYVKSSVSVYSSTHSNSYLHLAPATVKTMRPHDVTPRVYPLPCPTWSVRTSLSVCDRRRIVDSSLTSTLDPLNPLAPLAPLAALMSPTDTSVYTGRKGAALRCALFFVSSSSSASFVLPVPPGLRPQQSKQLKKVA